MGTSLQHSVSKRSWPGILQPCPIFAFANQCPVRKGYCIITRGVTGQQSFKSTRDARKSKRLKYFQVPDKAYATKFAKNQGYRGKAFLQAYLCKRGLALSLLQAQSCGNPYTWRGKAVFTFLHGARRVDMLVPSASSPPEINKPKIQFLFEKKL